jgi:hypothetical protein
MPNYDASQVGEPYVRVPHIHIDYPEPLTATVRINEVEAVKLADGSVRTLAQLGDMAFTIRPQDMATSLQLVHPDTGVPIPGATMTYQQIMLGLLAAIRAKQIERDTPPPAPEPEPLPEQQPLA